MYRNSQVQKQKQTLKILPQQIQFLNLLQLNSAELDQYINKELEENPYLEYDPNSTNTEPAEPKIEREDFESDVDFEDPMNWGSSYEDDTPSYNLKIENGFAEDRRLIASEADSWRKVLKNQMKLDEEISSEKLHLVEFIIDSLQEDGMLNQSIETLTDNISISQGQFIDQEEMEVALEIVQDADPAGIGARDLKECLLLQIDRLLISKNSIETIENARQIVEQHLEDLAGRSFNKIKENLNIDTEEIREAMALITSLNPHPISVDTDSLFSGNSVITPDYQIEIEGEEIIVSVTNSKVGSVRLGKEAIELSQKKLDKKAANFLKMKMEDARWLEVALRQRDSTMLDTMKIIASLQRSFFLTGDKNQLNPMILKDIADKLDLDVSTISRVTSRKYVQTPYGIFQVKDLFVQSFTNKEGASVTTNEIQNVLAEIIAEEDKSKPLNDSQIQAILKEKGFPIARRTVAKYRENLGIPVSLKRRALI